MGPQAIHGGLRGRAPRRATHRRGAVETDTQDRRHLLWGPSSAFPQRGALLGTHANFRLGRGAERRGGTPKRRWKLEADSEPGRRGPAAGGQGRRMMNRFHAISIMVETAALP